MLVLKNINEIYYYINICEKNYLTKEQLRDKINNREYDRLSNEVKNKIIKKDDLEIIDLIPNPIIIKDVNKDKLTEYALKQAILNNLDDFLLQLGECYTYVGNEYKIKIGDRYNYIDLLLFNIKYNSFVVVELKVTELKKEHIGQIQIYMNYIDRNVKEVFNDKTIGLIICKKDNKFVIEYSSDSRIYSREYVLN